MISLNTRLILAGDNLLSPGKGSKTNLFEISEGESAISIAQRLEQNGWVLEGGSFLVYLQYSNLDRKLLPGIYSLTAGTSAVDIAQEISSGEGRLTELVILPGWRKEEIASALEGYNLGFAPEDFIHLVESADHYLGIADISTDTTSLEGRLFPGSYYISQKVSADEFIRQLLEAFSSAVTPQMELAYHNEGLTLDQAIVLASMIEKEIILDEEAPLIA